MTLLQSKEMLSLTASHAARQRSRSHVSMSRWLADHPCARMLSWHLPCFCSPRLPPNERAGLRSLADVTSTRWDDATLSLFHPNDDDTQRLHWPVILRAAGASGWWNYAPFARQQRVKSIYQHRTHTPRYTPWTTICLRARVVTHFGPTREARVRRQQTRSDSRPAWAASWWRRSLHWPSVAPNVI